MASSANVRLRHAQYYQEILNKLGETFKQSESGAIFARDEFALNLEQFVRGQHYVATARHDQANLLDVRIQYAQSVYLLTMFLDTQQRIQWIETAITAAQASNQHQFVCTSLMQLAINHNILGNVEKSKAIYLKTIEYATEHEVNKFLPDAWYALGALFTTQSRYAEATNYYKRALSYLSGEEQLRDKIETLISLGGVSTEQEDFEEAVRYYDEAVKLSLDIGDQKINANLQHELGKFYMARGTFERAIEPLQESLAAFDSTGHWIEKRHVFVSLGNAYANLKRYTEAEQAYSQAIEISRKIGDQYALTSHLIVLSGMYLQSARFEDTHNTLSSASKITEDLNNMKLLADVTLMWAKFHIAQAEISEAIPYLFTAEEIYEELGVQHGLETTRNLIQKYKPKGIFLIIGQVLFWLERLFNSIRGKFISI